MDVSLRVLRISEQLLADDHLTEQPQKQKTLECALFLEQDLFRPVHFDGVRLSLHGRLRSQTGGHISVTKILSLEKKISWTDFYPATSRKSPLTSRQQADITFDVDTTVAPSLTIDVTSEITKDSALGNRHVVKGRADVDYWFEASFTTSSGSGHTIAGAVHVPGPGELTVLPLHAHQLPSFCVSRPKRLLEIGTSSSKSLGEEDQLHIRLDKSLGSISHNKSATTSTRLLSIPITVNLLSTRPASALVQSLQTRGAECSVTAKWHITRSISSVAPEKRSRRGSNSLSRCSTITQVTRTAVPPFYGRSTDDRIESRTGYQQCSATATVELSLPYTAVVPTIRIPGLSVQYELELKLLLYGVGNGLDKNARRSSLGETTFKIPVVLCPR
ncbi:uncharacterized protein HMPREF1541_03598 [Cyphellophora europaea CBS 101466]|uniref:Arrestin-like N-terminal domain-containing protein n=1 Tax=Cyphellophora europaea (strain CBS 101466) TaxID=1220924 RepID=W2RYY0_CYPE1|nr:uncharacterized protein HMPREF1541_03598 [Cyphellophora europaea CBS 101466]ETN41662.1 hypothetical protein HMPREF1541_03598 [Cyphellophora europaea CBS 101466]